MNPIKELLQYEDNLRFDSVFLNLSGFTHYTHLNDFQTGDVSQGLVGALKSNFDGVVKARGRSCNNFSNSGYSSICHFIVLPSRVASLALA
jgi:hypothetical protein